MRTDRRATAQPDLVGHSNRAVAMPCDGSCRSERSSEFVETSLYRRSAAANAFTVATLHRCPSLKHATRCTVHRRDVAAPGTSVKRRRHRLFGPDLCQPIAPYPALKPGGSMGCQPTDHPKGCVRSQAQAYFCRSILVMVLAPPLSVVVKITRSPA